jgi:hypothetical protein
LSASCAHRIYQRFLASSGFENLVSVLARMTIMLSMFIEPKTVASVVPLPAIGSPARGVATATPLVSDVADKHLPAPVARVRGGLAPRALRRVRLGPRYGRDRADARERPGMNQPCRMTLLLLALSIAAGWLPVAAADGQGDSTCKRNLQIASSSVSDVMGRLNNATAGGDDKCVKYRQQFLTLVRARAILAVCQSGPARDASIVRLDGTIDQVNGAIAESCEIQ